MSGDWIKMRNNLETDPRVIQMATELELDELHVVGCLWKLWAWADQHSIDGNALSVTDVTLDRFTRVNGFAQSLRNIGWLEGENGALRFPRFDEHNGQTAKKRAQTATRVARSRSGKNSGESGCNASSVTDVTHQALPEKRREEKRREEGSVPPKAPQGGREHAPGQSGEEPEKPPARKRASKTTRTDPGDPWLRRLSLAMNPRSGGRVTETERKEWQALREGMEIDGDLVDMLECWIADSRAAKFEGDPHRFCSRNLTTLFRSVEGQISGAERYWSVVGDDCPAGEIVDGYNEMLASKGLPGAVHPTFERRKLIRDFWQWCGRDMEEVRKFFATVRESRFLRGKGQSGWKPDLSWLLEPENRVKVGEGAYR